VRFLLDTHVLLWASGDLDQLSPVTRALLVSEGTELFFSSVNLWEIAIKRGLGRDDFQIEPRSLYRGLIENGYQELPITSQHTFAVELLPPLHRDPFDRILIAQAMVEGLILLTADEKVSQYPGPVRLV
jgi:PIN domain nuclease of toxin-antitoxin system